MTSDYNRPGMIDQGPSPEATFIRGIYEWMMADQERAIDLSQNFAKITEEEGLSSQLGLSGHHGIPSHHGMMVLFYAQAAIDKGTEGLRRSPPIDSFYDLSYRHSDRIGKRSEETSRKRGGGNTARPNTLDDYSEYFQKVGAVATRAILETLNHLRPVDEQLTVEQKEMLGEILSLSVSVFQELCTIKPTLSEKLMTELGKNANTIDLNILAAMRNPQIPGNRVELPAYAGSATPDVHHAWNANRNSSKVCQPQCADWPILL